MSVTRLITARDDFHPCARKRGWITPGMTGLAGRRTLLLQFNRIGDDYECELSAVLSTGTLYKQLRFALDECPMTVCELYLPAWSVLLVVRAVDLDGMRPHRLLLDVIDIAVALELRGVS